MAEGNVATTGAQVGLDKAAMRKSVDAFAVKLEADVAEKAALKDAKGRLKIESATKPLSEELPNKVLNLDEEISVMKAISSGRTRAVLETRQLLKDTKAKYEPVIYVKGEGANFLPAIVTPDREHDDYFEDYHAAISDIGPNAILEEVVRDKDDPNIVLEVRYWRKSANEEALNAAKQVRFGRSEYKVETDGTATEITNPAYKFSDKGAKIEFRFNDKNRLLSEPIVLEQLSPEAVKTELTKPDKVLVRYDDMSDPKNKMAALNEIREPRVKSRQPEVQDLYGTAQPEQAGVQPQSEVSMEDSFAAPDRPTVVTESDKSAGMEVSVGNTVYKKVILGRGRNQEARYQRPNGTELNQSEMAAEIRKNRIGQVTMENGDIYWNVSEANYSPFAKGAKRNDQREKGSVYWHGNDESALKLADKVGLTLANAEQLARENVFNVTEDRESKRDFRDIPDAAWDDLALSEVEDIVVAEPDNHLVRYFDSNTKKRYEVRFTPFVARDGQRLVSVREFSADDTKVTKRLRLADETDVAKFTQTTDLGETNNPDLEAFLVTANTDNTQTDAKTVLGNLDRVMGVQV